MSDVFDYRPKFVDIRVCKPDPAKTPLAQDGAAPAGAKTTKSKSAKSKSGNERPCDHIGCTLPGAHRAPKARERSNEFWYFCRDHAADYNRRWNYFSGMSDTEVANFQKASETGHRPTWTFRSGRLDGNSAAVRGFQAGRRHDPFGMFGSGPTAERVPERARRLTRLQTLALQAMFLEEGADAPQIRARYAELVKRWHPDSNGGDRGAEANLQRVVQAYQTLKAGGLV